MKPESYPPVQLKRNLGVHYDKVWEIWLNPNNTIWYISFVTSMFFLLFATMGVWFRGSRRVSSWTLSGPNTGSLTESSHGLWGSACDKVNLIAKMVMSL